MRPEFHGGQNIDLRWARRDSIFWDRYKILPWGCSKGSGAVGFVNQCWKGGFVKKLGLPDAMDLHMNTE